MSSQIKRLGKNSLIYGVGTLLNRFIGLLLLPLFTSYLTPGDYGILSMLALLVVFLQPIFSLGISAGMGPIYFDSINKKIQDETIWTSFILLLLSSIFLIVFSSIFKNSLSLILFKNTEYGLIIVLHLIGIAFEIMSTSFRLRLQYDERAVEFIVLTTISLLLSIFLRILFIVSFSEGVLGFVKAQLIFRVLSFIGFYLVAMKGSRSCFNKVKAKHILKLSLPLVPSFAFLFIIMQSNHYILQYFWGLDIVGIYSIGFSFGMVMGVFVNAFTTAWYPFFMSFINKREEAKIIFGRILSYYTIGFGFLCSLFFFFAKPIVIIMTQEPFFGASKVVGLTAFSQVLTGFYTLLLVGIYFEKELKYIPVIQLITSLFSLVLNLVIIKQFGLFGAALGLVFGNIFLVISMLLWNYYRRFKYIKIKNNWRVNTKFLLLSSVIIYLFSLINTKILLMDILFAVLFSALMIVVVLYFSNKNDRVFIINFLFKRQIKEL